MKIIQKKKVAWYKHPQVQCDRYMINTPNCLNKVITLEEVKQSIKDLQTGKAPGIDDIPSELLKLAGNNIKVLLTDLFNAPFDLNYYPEAWGDAVIVLLHKQG